MATKKKKKAKSKPAKKPLRKAAARKAKPKAKPKVKRAVVAKKSASAKPKPKAKAKAKKTPKPRKKYCLHTRCRQEANVEGYCRLHYIENWKTIRLNRQVKAERRLNSFVSRLMRKYPQEYMEKIKEGLEDEAKFKETMGQISGEADHQNPDEEATEREFLEKFARDLKLGNE